MKKDLSNNSKHAPSWMMAVVLFVFGCMFISAGIVETSTFAQGKWKNTKYGFGVPAYFSNGSEYFYGDGPYSMQIYKHQNAEISYCGHLGYRRQRVPGSRQCHIEDCHHQEHHLQKPKRYLLRLHHRRTHLLYEEES